MEPAANFDETALLKRLKEGDSTSMKELNSNVYQLIDFFDQRKK